MPSATRHASIADIEAMLQNMMLTNDWTKTKLKTEVQGRGICLRNGKEYGKKLPYVLKGVPSLLVKKDAAKEFPLAKMCLVTTPA
jgi:hypothetical protein